jgi:hypothetical protein
MTAAARARTPSDCGHPAAARGAESSGDFSGLLSGRPCDPLAFRRCYPDRWSGFLRAHFRGPLEVALFFSVDERTARQWWEGTTGPQGWAPTFAVAAIPGAARFLARAA